MVRGLYVQKRITKDCRDLNNTIREVEQQRDAQFSQLEKLEHEEEQLTETNKVMNLLLGKLDGNRDYTDMIKKAEKLADEDN